jgi:DNA-binding LacI/PurR family transcriptional regulator
MNRNEPTPISLADVAQAARVSITTVSLVLRGMGNISSKTRNHVRKVAQKLGYRPNLAASLLARQSHDHTVPAIPIALIGMGTKPFTSHHFVRSFTQHATEIGFQVIKPELSACSDFSHLLRVLYHQGVRGIVLNHSFDVRQISDKDAVRFSFLFHGKSLTDHRFHYVGTEIFESTRLLWETIWERGYRRIGAAICRHQQELQDDFAREDAVFGCQLRHNAQHIPPFLGDHNDYDGIVHWVRDVKPDAIIAFNSAIDIPLLQAGFNIPEDIALCALHIHETEERVTGLYQNVDDLGRIAAHQIESMICRNETGFAAYPHALLVAPVFKEGVTLPPFSSSFRQPALK